MRLTKYIWLAAFVVWIAVPAPARADWLLTPLVGANFGGDADKTSLATGLSIGWMGEGVVGWEADFGYSPNFFRGQGGGRIDKSNEAHGMINLILGVPVGGQSGPGVRPYVSFGGGWLRTSLSGVNELVTSDNSAFGIDAGVGVIGFTSDHFGLRGDVRYFRSLQDPEEDLEFDVALGGFNFVRGSLGFVFRF